MQGPKKSDPNERDPDSPIRDEDMDTDRIARRDRDRHGERERFEKPENPETVRPAGPEAMRDKPKRPWTDVDEESDESFPASDPPANY